MAIFSHRGARATDRQAGNQGQTAAQRDTRARVATVLEKSRQNVKYIVKAEREGEKITPEIVNLRLK